MRKQAPTELNLIEVPASGVNLQYSNTSGELNEALKDLIANQGYSIALHVEPIGDGYQVTGNITGRRTLSCSRCAIDFHQMFSQEVQEILIVEEPAQRTDKYSTKSQTNLNESVPFCYTLETPLWNIAEFLHELIASSEPLRPLLKPSCEEGNCDNYRKFQQTTSHSDLSEEIDSTHPFSALSPWRSH